MADATLDYIKTVVDRMTVEDQLNLVEHVVKNLRQAGGVPTTNGAARESKPQSLRGIWRDHFPPDLDIDAALHEIRHEWEEELREFADE